MPPWFADPQVGHFANDRSLSQKEIDTIVAWVTAGAPKGDPKDMPAPVNFVEGWAIPKPDVIFQLPKEFSVPESGMVEYQYVIVPTGFTEDKWVQAVEVRPTERSVVHHIIAYIREPGSNYFKDQKRGVFFEAPPAKTDENVDTSALPGDFLVGYAPGQPAEVLPVGEAKLVKAGSDIVFEMHYTAAGKPAADRSKIGLVLAKAAPARRYFFSAGPTASNLVIPPGDGNAEVVSEVTVGLDDAKLVYAQPHMHLRGKDFELRLIYPTGETETVLKGKFDFEWQMGYDFAKPIVVPKGTRVIAITHLDNSPNNPFNPDPTKEVRWGPQNWDEMSNIFLGLTFDLEDNPAKLFKRSGPSLLPPGKSGPTISALEVVK
jgi:hypothetical protein